MTNNQTEIRIEHQTFDQERALYGQTGICAVDCTFAGPRDGESALKEARRALPVPAAVSVLARPKSENHRLRDDRYLSGGVVVFGAYSG